jgi:hypothetical protein
VRGAGGFGYKIYREGVRGAGGRGYKFYGQSAPENVKFV